MNIKEARIEDAATLSEIAVEAVEPDRHLDFTDAGWRRFLSATTVDATQARLRNECNTCFYAENKGRILGFITIQDGEKVDQLFVRPCAQRAGIARRLWEYAKLACSSEEQPKDYWVKSSTIAIPAYRQLGFIECGGPITENGITHQLMKTAGGIKS